MRRQAGFWGVLQNPLMELILFIIICGICFANSIKTNKYNEQIRKKQQLIITQVKKKVVGSVKHKQFVQSALPEKVFITKSSTLKIYQMSIHYVKSYMSGNWDGCHVQYYKNSANTLSDSLKKYFYDSLPNVFTLLKLFSTIPLSSCWCESQLRF